jgi:predicted RND superfamily exporter protein
MPHPSRSASILGVIGLAGILMRNTLILIGQIHHNQHEGLDIYRAVIEATVERGRPVLLTAIAAVLAFIELTSTVFWGSMAYVLAGGTLIGTLLILLFLPALCSMWNGVRPPTPPSRLVNDAAPGRAESGTNALDQVPGTKPSNQPQVVCVKFCKMVMASVGGVLLLPRSAGVAEA